MPTINLTDSDLWVAVPEWLFDFTDGASPSLFGTTDLTARIGLLHSEPITSGVRVEGQELLDGKLTILFADGTKALSAGGIGGRLHGEFLLWYRDGSLAMSTSFETGLEVGPRVIKSSAQDWMDRVRTIPFRNGLRNGLLTDHDDGELTYSESYEDGQLHGPLCYYEGDGNSLSSKEFYEHGKQHGPVEYYRQDGSVSDREEYRDGHQHGPYQRWHANGQLSDEGSYRDGALTWFKQYSEDGVLEEEWAEGREHVVHVPQGCVYALINPSMPGLVKVGYSERSADERARELSAATGVPTPFVVAYTIPARHPRAGEKMVHEELLAAGHQYNPGREFFTAPLEVVVRLMAELEGTV